MDRNIWMTAKITIQHERPKERPGVRLVAVTGVLVDVVHGFASGDTVHNVQPNHDNQLARNDSPQTQPGTCKAANSCGLV